MQQRDIEVGPPMKGGGKKIDAHIFWDFLLTFVPINFTLIHFYYFPVCMFRPLFVKIRCARYRPTPTQEMYSSLSREEQLQLCLRGIALGEPAKCAPPRTIWSEEFSPGLRPKAKAGAPPERGSAQRQSSIQRARSETQRSAARWGALVHQRGGSPLMN